MYKKGRIVAEKKKEKFIIGEDDFRGQEMAARWWQKYRSRPFASDGETGELSPEVKAAVKELVNYTISSLPGIERFMKTEDAIRAGFKMGYTFYKSQQDGDFDAGDEIEQPDTPAMLDGLFSPEKPKGAH